MILLIYVLEIGIVILSIFMTLVPAKLIYEFNTQSLNLLFLDDLEVKNSVHLERGIIKQGRSSGLKCGGAERAGAGNFGVYAPTLVLTTGGGAEKVGVHMHPLSRWAPLILNRSRGS